MKFSKPAESTQHTGAPIFTPADAERFRNYLHRAQSDTTPEFFNRRLKTAMVLIKHRYGRVELSRARAIDEMLCALECADRKDGYCYQLLKTELKKERAKWTAK